jgi:hypothetical protein
MDKKKCESCATGSIISEQAWTNRLSDLLLVRLASLQLWADVLVGCDELAVEISQAAQLVEQQLHLSERDFVAGSAPPRPRAALPVSSDTLNAE